MTVIPLYPTRREMSSTGTPASEGSETKLCRISRGVHSFGLSPASATTARNSRRTLCASSSVLAAVMNTRSSSDQGTSCCPRQRFCSSPCRARAFDGPVGQGDHAISTARQCPSMGWCSSAGRQSYSAMVVGQICHRPGCPATQAVWMPS